MNILVGDWEHIDFDGPVKLSETDREKFIEFLKKELGFAIVEVEEVEESRTKRIGDYLPQRPWTRREISLVIYSNERIEELREKLGRTWMSINIPRGRWLLAYGIFEKKNGFKTKTRESVDAFIDEYFKKKEDERKARKNQISLKICGICGLLHDPEIYDKDTCFRCAERTLEVYKVKKEEKEEIYLKQPEFMYKNNETGTTLKELFEKYPGKEKSKR